MHLTASIKRAMVIAANEIATIDGERVRTWAECGERVRRLAGALRHELGLGDGARAALLAHNIDRYFEVSHAIPWAGGVLVPINTRLAPGEVDYMLSDSGAELLFVDDAFAAMAASLKERLPALRELIHIGDGETPAGMANYEELIGAACSQRMPSAKPNIGMMWSAFEIRLAWLSITPFEVPVVPPV